MGAMLKSSEYRGPIRRMSYSYVSGIVGMAYNLFIKENVRDCFFDYEQAVMLRFWILQELRQQGALLISRLSWDLCWKKR